ncbi:hypothetical protein [Agrococcus jejuensis]|uniref:Uncharacterized protein n=1 Tax=Agrococcus jejuensis TaxID=399736 RepID=A0A1G8E6U7_9MICO|nr:hypothetical protein [Agrococcus jejuensis]SDH65597.1 hypothetical protein SAMN04489720_1910 [Agrococcus jejuensis]
MSIVLGITCDRCGRHVEVLRARLDDVLAEDPSIVAIMDRFWARKRWIHDAAFGFAFCSDACARAHGAEERPDERWLEWVTAEPT